MELDRLDDAESAFQASKDDDDDDERVNGDDHENRRRQMRRQCVHLYRTGQRKILQENITVLEAGLTSFFAPSSATIEGRPFGSAECHGILLTLNAAFDVLKVLHVEKHDSVLSGLATTYGLSYNPKQPTKLLAQFREMGVEEVAWAVWIGTVVKLRRHRDETQAMAANEEQDPAIQGRLWQWCSWLEVVYELRVEENMGETIEAHSSVKADDDGFLQHLLEVVQNMQADSRSLDVEPPWSSSFVAACGAVVQAESLVVRAKSGTAMGRKVNVRGNGKEQAEEHTARRPEEGRDADMTEIVVLYVGPGLEMK